MMHTCPRCQTTLGDLQQGEVRAYPCDHCGGHALTLSQLRAVSARERFNRLWQAARSGTPSALRCPSCTATMRVADVSGVEVDVCLRCQMIWLDAGEQERLVGLRPLPAAEPTADEIDVRRLMAEEKISSMAENARLVRRAHRVRAVLETLLWWSI